MEHGQKQMLELKWELSTFKHAWNIKRMGKIKKKKKGQNWQEVSLES